MGRLFCILGKSGSGKDTVFKALMSDPRLLLRGVVTYTTRPRRVREREGVEYHFITDAQLALLAEEGRILELRQYETVQGTWSYGTVDDGQIDLSAGDYLMIVTLPAYENLRRHFGAGAVVPLYLEVEDGPRYARALSREKKEPHPDFEELRRRFAADSADFSEARLMACGIQKRFRNENLTACVREITDYMRHGTQSAQKE